VSVEQLITAHLDIWTAADTEKKSGRGRSSGNAGSVYGIKKLRELILELAVRGKLVPQDESDEPASELLKRIAAEKAKLVADGKIKKDKSLPPITNDERLFTLPHRWEWARLDDIGNTFIGLTYSPKDVSNTGTPVLRSSNIQNGEIDLIDLVRVESSIKSSLFVDEGDLLICARNGSKSLVGKTAMIKNLNEPMVFGAFMAIYKSPINFYVEVFLNSPMFRKFLDGVETTTINQITQNNLKTTLIPVPPNREQHRIVAKVDELMTLCDQLENQHNNAAVAHEKLVTHLLGTLTQSQNAEDFNTQWQRISEHFDTLFTTEASIDALKQTLLQLAVMGKLVPQDATDEPAIELLKRIAAEKANMVKLGLIKMEKASLPIIKNDTLIPSGWILCRWNNMAIKIGDIDHKMPETVSNGIPYVSPRDFYPNNVIDFNGAKGISRSDYDRLSAKIKPDKGDLIYPRYGTIGENRLVMEQREFLASYSCAVIKTMKSFIDAKYQYIFSISSHCREQAKAAENKTTQANVGIASIQQYIVPLPPLAEQHRIVTKVDELMAICDQLKSRLTAANQLQQKLADVVIEQAIN
jgi:type I restriction enzyme, S subunit